MCLDGAVSLIAVSEIAAEATYREVAVAVHRVELVDVGELARRHERHSEAIDSRQRVAQVSRGIEAVFEETVREGVRSGDFRSDLDPRLTMLAILGATNGVPSWYHKEGVSLEKISANLIRLVLDGIANPDRPVPKRGRR